MIPRQFRAFRYKTVCTKDEVVIRFGISNSLPKSFYSVFTKRTEVQTVKVRWLTKPEKNSYGKRLYECFVFY